MWKPSEAGVLSDLEPLLEPIKLQDIVSMYSNLFYVPFLFSYIPTHHLYEN